MPPQQIPIFHTHKKGSESIGFTPLLFGHFGHFHSLFFGVTHTYGGGLSHTASLV